MVEMRDKMALESCTTVAHLYNELLYNVFSISSAFRLRNLLFELYFLFSGRYFILSAVREAAYL